MIRQKFPITTAAGLAFALAGTLPSHADEMTSGPTSEPLDVARDGTGVAGITMLQASAIPCSLAIRCDDSEQRERAKAALALLYLGIRKDCVTRSCTLSVGSSPR